MRRRSCRSSCARGVRPDMVTDQTSAHDLVNGYLPAGWSVERWQAAQARSGAARGARRRGARRRCAAHVEAMLAFHAQGVPTFDYGNNIRQVAQDEGRRQRVRFPRLRAGVHPAAVLRRQGAVPLGRAVGRSRGHLQDRSQGEGAVSRTTRTCIAGSTWRGERIAFQGLPARICWLGLGERHRAGLAFNEMVASGEAEGADRDRPRSPRYRLGREPQPRDRSDGGRLRRGVRLAAAERAAQHGRRRDVGVDPSRRRRRHGLFAACRRGDRLRRHATPRRSASSACCGTIRRRA